VKRLLGVDACKHGWVVAEACHDLSDLRFWGAPTVKQLFEAIDESTICAIDIPIGLLFDRRVRATCRPARF
jgi:predicted RNase H-like nuclease